MIKNFDFICVDYQYDFINPNGKNYVKGESVTFIQNVLIPYFMKNDIKVAEIISDYRLPRGKSKNESCVPGTNGFISQLPDSLRKNTPWIKCMHNPLWIRKNIGLINVKLGPVFQCPEQFNKWISKNIKHDNIVLFGETADCCLLQVASELYFRGFNVFYIYEATDPMAERLKYKNEILYHSSVSIYVKTLKFNEFIKIFEGEKI